MIRSLLLAVLLGVASANNTTTSEEPPSTTDPNSMDPTATLFYGGKITYTGGAQCADTSCSNLVTNGTFIAECQNWVCAACNAAAGNTVCANPANDVECSVYDGSTVLDFLLTMALAPTTTLTAATVKTQLTATATAQGFGGSTVSTVAQTINQQATNTAAFTTTGTCTTKIYSDTSCRTGLTSATVQTVKIQAAPLTSGNTAPTGDYCGKVPFKTGSTHTNSWAVRGYRANGAATVNVITGTNCNTATTSASYDRDVIMPQNDVGGRCLQGDPAAGNDIYYTIHCAATPAASTSGTASSAATIALSGLTMLVAFLMI